MQINPTIPDDKNNTLVSLVRSVADMEVRYFTLTEAAKKTRKDACNKNDNAAFRLKNAKEELDEAERDMQRALTVSEEESSYRKYRKRGRTAGRFWGEFFTFFFLYGFVAGVSSPLLSGLLEWLIFGNPFSNMIGTFIAPLLIFWLIVYYCVFRAIRQREYRSSVGGNEAWVHRSTDRYKKAQEGLTLVQKEQQETELIAEMLSQKAEELENSAMTVRKDLTQCYELGVIPPAYQNLICVVLIDEIFKNNKADSMREAILLCDMEIRHAEIVNKLTDINHSLQSLADNLHSMSVLLQDINTNIASISTDVSSISHRQSRIAYAVESIDKSADNVRFYVAQKNAGAL